MTVRYEVRCVLDGNACDNCRSRDGTQFAGEIWETPPYHDCTSENGCRCLIIRIATIPLAQQGQ